MRRGDLDDLDELSRAAAASDRVIHLAFKHDIAFAGDFDGAVAADRRAIETVGEALAGTDRPFVIASGIVGLAPGRIATEEDALENAPAGSVLHSVADEGVPVRAIAEVIGRQLLAWHPSQPSLIEDPEEAHYFDVRA